MTPRPGSSVIVALDFESSAAALALVERLGADTSHYKVGLHLLTEAGPELVRTLVAAGKQVFLDLKLHEIPNSVAGGVWARRLSACSWLVRWLWLPWIATPRSR